MERDELLLAITRCREIERARGDAGHPCAGIVGLQPPDQFQVPEPWRGHIDAAPILFVSSNPSIRGREPFPPAGWTDQGIIDYYQRSLTKTPAISAIASTIVCVSGQQSGRAQRKSSTHGCSRRRFCLD